MEYSKLTEAELLDQAKALRSQRDKLEAALEACRRESKIVALRMMFEFQYSLNRTSSLTGHMRPTLKVWAESEIARRADEGLTSPHIGATSTAHKYPF